MRDELESAASLANWCCDGYSVSILEKRIARRDRAIWNAAIRAAAEQCHDPILHTAIARLLKPEPKE